jgi:hypothetical protein
MASMSDFRVPPQSASEDQKAGWLRETVTSGEAWLKAQRAYPSIQESMDMVLSPAKETIPRDQSHVRIPRAKRQIRELVSLMANLKPTASNQTKDKALYATADVANKVDLSWWYNTFADRKFKDSFQAAALTGTVYVSHVWDTDLLGYKRGDIRTDVYDARDVLLINPPKDHDLQKCYAVVIKKRVPIHLVAARYPLRAHELIPDYGTKGYTQQGIDYVQSFMASPLRALSGQFDDPPAPNDIFPTLDLYETYIYDLSINMTGHEITMGEPGTSWSYTVPSYGSDIPTGLNGWEGLPTYRKATADDARIYPLRRKMEATDTKILYDDTAEWWHGSVPLARFGFDDWYTEALGFPLTRDVSSMEDGGNELLRGVIDMANVALDPPLAYDENLVSERLAVALNPRAPGQRLKGNMQMGDMIKALLPAGFPNLPTYVLDTIKYLNDQQDWVIGARDVMALAKAKQIPSEGTIDKLAEMSGPLAQDMTRSMEEGQRNLGEMRRWLNFQFRTKSDLMNILGPDGLTEEIYDYDPGNLIPSHMPDEDPEKGPSRYTQVQRARSYCGKLRYHVVANSMARLQQMSHKLILLQLYQRGLLPSDPWSVAEDFELPDWGPPPIGTTNRMERAIAWIHMQRELAEEGGGPPQKGEQRGRKSSNSKSPQVKQKGGGRSTVTTS